MQKEKIYYIGCSLKMLKLLCSSDLFEVEKVVCQKGKIPIEFIKECKEHGICLYEVNDKSELCVVCRDFKDLNIIMYEFGIIIPVEICNRFCIVNFHAGSLKTNRGANPISWSILLPEIGAEMCMHKITGDIDCGEIIGYRQVVVSDNDNVMTLKRKLEDCIPEMLSDLKRFFDGSYSGEMLYVTSGEYRRRITKEDYTIDLQRDSEDIIKRKINSQKTYKGAIVKIDGCEKYVKSYDENNKEIFLQDGTSYLCT